MQGCFIPGPLRNLDGFKAEWVVKLGGLVILASGQPFQQPCVQLCNQHPVVQLQLGNCFPLPPFAMLQPTM